MKRTGQGGHRRWRDLVVGTSILCLYLCGPGVQAAPWNQDEDLAALGSLDSLLAYEDLQRAVQMAEDDGDAWGRTAATGAGAGAGTGAGARSVKVAPVPWQPAEPDPQLYLLTEYDRGGQTRVKRNREPAAAAATPVGAAGAAAGTTAAAAGAAGAAGAGRLPGNSRGLRRHARNPPGGSGQRLSIVNPLDVLRQRLLLEIARRRKASVPQSNREMLEGIGKRSWNQVQTNLVDQQIERCLSHLSDTVKPQDKLTRLAILYKAIEYGNCDSLSEVLDEPGQRQQQQPQQRGRKPQDQAESNQVHDEQEATRQDEEWSARQRQRQQQQQQQQASGWFRNVRAATSSNLVS